MFCSPQRGGLPERRAVSSYSLRLYSRPTPPRQVNMDYSLAHALEYKMNGIRNVVTFYDINCSFMKKLRARLEPSRHIGIPSDMKITPGIGIWHVHAHIQQCYARYAPLFIAGIGWIDGEVMETLWSILNVVSGSARGMTAPHRQEMLDFQMNDSNFMKMIRMGKVNILP